MQVEFQMLLGKLKYIAILFVLDNKIQDKRPSHQVIHLQSLQNAKHDSVSTYILVS